MQVRLNDMRRIVILNNDVEKEQPTWTNTKVSNNVGIITKSKRCNVKYICICIYIYIFTNLISTSIHGIGKKQKKPCSGTRDKSTSNSPPRGKRKKFFG